MNIGAYTNHILDSEPNLSEKELQERVNGYTALCWRQETKDGREFEKHFASPENIQALAAVFDTIDEQVSFESLSAAFRTLRQNGRILSEAEVEQARLETERQQDEANRIKWQNDCENWLAAHNTNQIKSRAESDPVFRSYLKSANRLPQLAAEYTDQNLKRQRHELQEQRAKDKPYLAVPEDLRNFAESYRRMSFADVQQRQRDPNFRAQVEAAAKANLI